MISIKICGITNLEDASLAIKAGADALGFVFSVSPRRVTTSVATEIIRNIPPFITKVGLFVDEEKAVIHQIMERCQLDCVQLHGQEIPEYAHGFKRPVIKAFRIKNDKYLDIERINGYHTAAYLFDAYAPGKPGGTGKTFAWDLLKDHTFNAPVILAGGLTAENVLQAIKTVRPYAVDVSSGVEKSPGRKDPVKLTNFIKQVKRYRE